MKKELSLGVKVASLGMLVSCSFFRIEPEDIIMNYTKSVASVAAMFPKTVQHIDDRFEHAKKMIKKGVDEIIAVPDEKKTFSNTMQALDEAIEHATMLGGTLCVVQNAYPDPALQNAARTTGVNLSAFIIDSVSQNIDLYKAFKAYAEGNAKNESLTPEQRYILQETMDGFKRSGLHLSKDAQDKIKAVKKELSQLSQDFSKNINEDKSFITVEREGLEGLDEDFINRLKKNKEGLYILGVDYPTYFNVMKHCAVEDTRKRLNKAFNKRAYPANIAILENIIAKRDELAHLLGYASYAHLDIDDEMAKTPERVRTFLNELAERSSKKEDKEFAMLTKELPSSVSLTEEGKLKPWDKDFLVDAYKKKYYDLDDRKVAEYFPMENTIDGLLTIYKTFFNLDMQEVPVSGVWHDDVKMIVIKKKGQDTVLGYLLLDLYPRDNKYSHACEIGVIKAKLFEDNKRQPAVAVVLANFPKSTKDKPSLLKHAQVQTFFHEFGHAIHEILGATPFASTSGTSVKTDFVEMPSQMLEEWLYDKEILKMISSHYKTGAPLPDDIIEKIIALKTLTSGQFVLRQVWLSFISLDYYNNGARVDTDAIREALHKKMLDYKMFDSDDHFQASFGHLTGYASKYYGYMWSKVFALDLFDYIKQHGLLNPDIGKRYEEKVLARGGSLDPEELLRDFLGRKPNQEAFFKDLGL